MQTIKLWPGWDIVRTLWQDDCGTVYEICKAEDGQFIRSALRVIYIPDGSTMRENLRKIEDRMAVLAELQGNSHIVSYEDHSIIFPKGASGCYVLIRMELLESLESWLPKHSVSEETVLKTGTDICDAMIRCSRMQIFNKQIDLKNIYVNKFGDFKLGGLERVSINKTENMRGSFEKNCFFNAPEVVRGEACDASAEIYSLAMVLYYLLNECRFPHGAAVSENHLGASRTAGFPGSITGMPEPLHGTPALKAVIMKALSYDPKARYQSAEEFQRALVSCRTADTKVSLNADSAGSRHRKGIQYSIIAGLACIFIAVLVMGVFTLLPGRSNEDHGSSQGEGSSAAASKGTTGGSSVAASEEITEGSNGAASEGTTGGSSAAASEGRTEGSNGAASEGTTGGSSGAVSEGTTEGSSAATSEETTDDEENPYDKAGTVQPIETAEIGCFVLFGKWEQDADTQNGKEEIEWIVLDRSDGKLLLISKCVIDFTSYAGVRTVSTWDHCALRSWLNEEFFEEAFSTEEKNRVIISDVSADPNPRFGTEAGSDTKDKVFLLSIEEAEHYIGENLLRGCEATAYTKQTGGFKDRLYGDLMWWLRSPGINENFVAYVKDDTEIHMDGYPEDSYLGVRPVIRIEQ